MHPIWDTKATPWTYLFYADSYPSRTPCHGHGRVKIHVTRQTLVSTSQNMNSNLFECMEIAKRLELEIVRWSKHLELAFFFHIEFLFCFVTLDVLKRSQSLQIKHIVRVANTPNQQLWVSIYVFHHFAFHAIKSNGF